jgi:hypothetical protein
MPIAPADILFLDTTLAAILSVLIVIAWIVGLVDVITRRPDLDRTKRLAWILLIVILPIVGTGLYFVLRPARTITAGSS